MAPSRRSTIALAAVLLGGIHLGDAAAQMKQPPAIDRPLDGPVRIDLIPPARAQCTTTTKVRQWGAWDAPKTITGRSNLFVSRESGQVVLGSELDENGMSARMMFPIGTDGRLASVPPIIQASSKELQAAIEQIVSKVLDSLGGTHIGLTFTPGVASPTPIDPCKPLGATLRHGGKAETIALGFAAVQGRQGLLLQQTINVQCAASEGVFDFWGQGWSLIDRASGLYITQASLFTASSRGTSIADYQTHGECLFATS